MINLSIDKKGAKCEMQEKLLLIRKNKNIKQQFMADLIGISANQYGLKENGKYNFDCDEMFTIAEYLGMKIEDIFLPSTHQNGVGFQKESG